MVVINMAFFEMFWSYTSLHIRKIVYKLSVALSESVLSVLIFEKQTTISLISCLKKKNLSNEFCVVAYL